MARSRTLWKTTAPWYENTTIAIITDNNTIHPQKYGKYRALRKRRGDLTDHGLETTGSGGGPRSGRRTPRARAGSSETTRGAGGRQTIIARYHPAHRRDYGEMCSRTSTLAIAFTGAISASVDWRSAAGATGTAPGSLASRTRTPPYPRRHHTPRVWRAPTGPASRNSQGSVSWDTRALSRARSSGERRLTNGMVWRSRRNRT